MVAPSGEQAVANARQVDTYPAGMCLKYVREQWRIGSLYGSAIDAWYGAVDRHPGDRTPPLGAALFYEGGQHGHIVLGVKANADPMRGTDMPSSGRVGEDVIAWPENHWGQKYLGWTGDLNGVDLPLGDEDEMTPADWDKLRGIVREEVQKAKPDYVKSFLAGEVDEREPDATTVKKALRLSADAARDG